MGTGTWANKCVQRGPVQPGPANYDCGTCKFACQGFCELGKQAVSDNIESPGIPTISKNDIIIKKLPKAKVQALMDYLYEASNLGSYNKSGPLSATVNDKSHLKASDINKLIAQIKTLNDADPGMSFSRDQIIYASQINTIMNYIRNAQLDGSSAAGYAACNTCNMNCNTCVTCVNCY